LEFLWNAERAARRLAGSPALGAWCLEFI